MIFYPAPVSLAFLMTRHETINLQTPAQNPNEEPSLSFCVILRLLKDAGVAAFAGKGTRRGTRQMRYKAELMLPPQNRLTRDAAVLIVA